MNQEYKFKGKGLFYAAAFVCFLTVILIPLGFYFIYLARVAKIIIRDDAFVYRMFTTNVINYGEIKSLTLMPVVRPGYVVGNQTVNFANVVPFVIETQSGKKVKMSLNYFEKPQEILSILEQKARIQAVVV